jgi:hypothetical protein
MRESMQQEVEGTSPQKEDPAQGVTVKAFLMGLVCSAIVAGGTQYGEIYLRSSRMSDDFSYGGAVFVFFFLVVFVNVILKLMGPRAAFVRGELILIYVMMMTSCAVTGMGLTHYQIPLMATLSYFTTPENAWATLITPHVSGWMVVEDPLAAKHFFEGLPQNMPLPWGAWLKPFSYWSVFFLSFYFSMVAIMVILRKQWTDHERLIYPIIRVPLDMVGDDDKPSLLSGFFKSPAMWAGFFVAAFVTSSIGISAYYDFLPQINVLYPGTSISMLRDTINLRFMISFPVLGFAYLINQDVAFGLWFFDVIAKIMDGVFNTVGLYLRLRVNDYGGTSGIFSSTAIGAMVTLVLYGGWVGRSHLKDVFRKAFRGDPEVDDSNEILSYRNAVFGLIAAAIIMLVWLNAAGLPVWAGILFLFISFVIFIAISRLVVEGGLAACRAPMIAPNFMLYAVGTPALGAKAVTALGFTYGWASDIRTFLMAAIANALKLLDEPCFRRRKRWVFGCIFASLIVSIIVSFGLMLRLSYDIGGVNIHSWFCLGANLLPFNMVSTVVSRPIEVTWPMWMNMGFGGSMMGLLTFLRYKYLWWPLHPLGLTVAGSTVMDWTWFSIFLAWSVKVIVLRYGGPGLYRATRPFFLGMVLGQFVSAGVWTLIDGFNGMTDNMIFVI